MSQCKNRRLVRQRLHQRIRTKIRGTSHRPRLAVAFTGQHIYAQVIDDNQGRTLVSVSTTEDLSEWKQVKPNITFATKVGKMMAERAKKKGVSEVVFDRGGFHYHGKVKALADAAREAGLRF